ncbi:MAG: hypothetical protein KGZ90_15565 [Algoriphagus sp.]|nr:hypothetical protein [Algoriphagus sp.]
MKKSLFVSLLILLFFQEVKSQNHSISIETELDKYFQATQNKDWKAVIDMINPKVFSFTAKEQMVQLYSQMESDAGMEMNFTEMEILKIRKGVEWRDTTYVPVDYKITLIVDLNPSRYQDPDMLKSISTGFEVVYGGQDISFDRERMSFTIRAKSTLIASSLLNSEQWYFGEYKPTDPITKLIFPEEILKRLEQGWN